MLTLKVYDGNTEVVLELEHSLLSLSKWESKYKKAFLNTPTKTSEEMIDYYQAMLLEERQDPTVIYRLSPEQLDEITTYINDPQTASSVPADPTARPGTEIVTSELIYYWMVALKINWEAQHWHLNRLMMLIQIANYKMQPEKKQSKVEAFRKWQEVNAKRKEQYGTTG